MKIYLHVHSSFFSSILIYYSKCLKNNINTEKKLIKDLFGTFCGTFFVPFQDLLGLLIDSNIKFFFIIIHIFLLFQLSKCLKNNINTEKKLIKEMSEQQNAERKSFETKMKQEYKLKKERWKREMAEVDTPKRY